MDHWNLQRTTFTVADFLGWMRNRELKLSPSFQRRPVWKSKAKSYFIDTIVRGLPVPIIFLRERIDTTNTSIIREVVDGQQRLRTVISYINGALLSDYDRRSDDFSISRAHNRDIAGLAFTDLSEDLKKRILGYQFSVDVLPRSASDQDVLQIFKRMNSTGQKLNAQELRNAEFSGYFAQLAYEMALEQLDRWRQWEIFKEDEIARMEEVELSSEIIIMIIRGLFGKTKSVIDGYYSQYEDKEIPYASVIQDRFRYLFDKMDEQLGSSISGSSLKRKAVFFNVAAVTYDLMFGLGSNITESKRSLALPRNYAKNLLLAGEQLDAGEATKEAAESAARRTTHLSSRRSVVNYLLMRINGVQAS